MYSTPAYAPTLELYGWTDLGPRLRDLIRHDRWDDLASVLSDEVLDTLVPCGTFDELPGLLRDRFAGLGQGIVVSPPADDADDEAFRPVIEALQAIPEGAAASAGHREDELLGRHRLDRGPALVVAHPGVALGRREHAWQQAEVPGRAEGVDARRREREVDAAVDALRRRPGARTTTWPSAPPWRGRRPRRRPSGRRSAQGRRATALITMTPTSRSAHVARSSSAASRYSGRAHRAG